MKTAAAGSASKMPKKPNKVPPAKTAKMTAMGCKPRRPPTRYGVKT